MFRWRERFHIVKKAAASSTESEETARHFLTHLKLFAEINNRLSQTPTLDILCYQTVELGRTYLGFTRLAIYLVDDDPQYVKRMWGIDEQGNLRDESNVRSRIETLPLLSEAASPDRNLVIRNNTNLYDHQGNIVSQNGWVVVIGLWNGPQCIGWLIADNLLHQQPLSQYAPEILRLYSNVISPLLTLRQIEQVLKKSEQRYRSIFEDASIGIAVVDRAGYLMSYNSAYCHIFGYSPYELRHTAFDERVDPNKREDFLEIFGQLRDQKITSSQLEVLCIHKDGRSMWVNINISTFPTQASTNNYMIAFVEDITARKQLAERTRELALGRERVKMLSSFVQSISHDFRTPLAIINTSVYLLEKSMTKENSDLHTRKISLQVEHLTTLVDGLLSMAKWDSGTLFDFEEIDITLIIRDIEANLRPFADQKSVHLTVEFDNVPSINADHSALYQALENIVKNAIEYTPNNGSVIIHAGSNEGYLVVEIQDTGIGIDDEELPYIFDLLYRADKARSTSGIGLGLTIAKKIIEGHNGRIDLETMVGTGSTFRVWLPLVSASASTFS